MRKSRRSPGVYAPQAGELSRGYYEYVPKVSVPMQKDRREYMYRVMDEGPADPPQASHLTVPSGGLTRRP